MLAGTHNTALVVLSVLIATAASYAALDLAGRIRASSGLICHAWLATAALAMGGGIWSMHFVAMLAFNMPGMEVGYDLGLTLLSLVAPILVTAVAFHVVNRRATGLVLRLSSGLFMGAGIVAMHYTGMAAMRMPADLTYDYVWVAVSVVIAIAASTVALWLAFRGSALTGKIGGSIAMGLAISGMHYAAMQGAIFYCHANADVAQNQAGIGQTALALAVAATTFLILFFALVAAMFDRRFAMVAAREAQALRESEERFRLLLKSVTDYAIFMLDADGRVSNWNAGAERIKGYRADEIIGCHIERFYTKEDAEAGAPMKALEIAARDGKFEAEGARVRKDGSIFWASVVIDAIKDEEGRLIGYAKVTRDITYRKKAEDALQATQQALFQSQKMEAVGQLTGGVAHDFNNLLMATLGSLELLRRRLPQDPKLLRHLDNAVRAAERGTDLTQRMLAFARRQDLRPKPVDLPQLVRGMADLLQRSIGPSVRIETQFPLHLPEALVDAHQLELALLNLAVNARDAMGDAGTITIAAQHAKGNRIGGASFLSDRDYVCLQVRDSGQGMDEATLARAKEPFFTTKGVGKGTGLGLSMVHGLAEQSGGGLILKSKQGVGTSAEIWLPVADATDTPQMLEASKLATEHALPALTIVVVDDDPIVLENTAAMLEEKGHRVLQATSGEGAMRILHSESTIDLVLTDYAMPGMSGLQLARAIRLEWPDMPLILATGYAELPATAGVSVQRLNKPFTETALTDAIRNVMGARQEMRNVVQFPARYA
jgi:PAS domain S-box-containing protein